MKLLSITAGALCVLETLASCKWNINGATYDLSPLASETFRVHDNSGDDWTQFDYFFQFCGDIDRTSTPIMTTTTPASSCDSTPNDDGSGGSISAPAAAFQLGYQYDHCRRLGDWSSANVSWLGDSPATGFRLELSSGGNLCPSGSARKAVFMFECYNGQYSIPTDMPVVESTDCEYYLHFRNTIGCPLECPAYQFQVCAGNGFCEHDPNKQSPACYCDSGYTGGACEVADPDAHYKKTDSHAGAFVGSFFGGIFLGAAMCGAAWWFYLRPKSEAAGGGGAGSGYAQMDDGVLDAGLNSYRPPEAGAAADGDDNLL